MTIMEFLHARLDEDEAVALRWPAKQRSWNGVGTRRLSSASGSGTDVAAIDVSGQPVLWWERIYVKLDADGLHEHITRHDPARVLREVAAKRAVVELHQGEHSCMEIRTGTYPDDWPTEVSWGAPGQTWRHASLETPEMIEWPCATLKHIAVVYADHPDYQQEWMP